MLEPIDNLPKQIRTLVKKKNYKQLENMPNLRFDIVLEFVDDLDFNKLLARRKNILSENQAEILLNKMKKENIGKFFNDFLNSRDRTELSIDFIKKYINYIPKSYFNDIKIRLYFVKYYSYGKFSEEYKNKIKELYDQFEDLL